LFSDPKKRIQGLVLKFEANSRPARLQDSAQLIHNCS